MPSDATRLSFYQARKDSLLRDLGLPASSLPSTEVAPLLSVLTVCAFGRVIGRIPAHVAQHLVEQAHQPFVLCLYDAEGWLLIGFPFADDEASFLQAAAALVLCVQGVPAHE